MSQSGGLGGKAEMHDGVDQWINSMKHKGNWVGNQEMTLLEGGKAQPSFPTPRLMPSFSPSHTFPQLQCSPSVVCSTLGRVLSLPTYKTWVETGA